MPMNDRVWPRAVVFDLDGTLIDSAPDIAEALNLALGKHGLAPFQLPRVKEMIGGGIPKLVERALLAHGVSPAAMPALVLDFVTAYRANLTTRTTLFDGAREVLDRLSGENRLLGLCSNKQHELTVEILQQLDLARYFSAVIGEGIGFARKPDPEPLNAVLAKLGARPEDAVMVGDSAADVECARAAGVIPVAVTFGYSKVAPEELGARAVVSHFNALHECFATLGPE